MIESTQVNDPGMITCGGACGLPITTTAARTAGWRDFSDDEWLCPACLADFRKWQVVAARTWAD